MIFVEGRQISEDLSSTQGHQLLLYLLQHPSLLTKTNAFKSLSEEIIRLPVDSKSVGSENSSSVKSVYVFQREYATVDPLLVELVGTDEATTCVGLVIRNRKTGLTSVAHLDSVERVKLGMLQMLSGVQCEDTDAELDVHLMGGFDDTSERSFDNVFKSYNSVTNTFHSSDNALLTQQYKEKLVLDGYSWPLCLRIIEVLQSMDYYFHIQTLCILNHNTSKGPNGFAFPIIKGFVVNTVTGVIVPASFDTSARCPDEVVRRVRVSVSYEDPRWKGCLLETYDTHSDRFVVSPCKWSPKWKNYAAKILQLSDSEFLLQFSTSPYAESPDFVDTERRVFGYLLKNPDWKSTFSNGEPRIFTRTSSGGWIACAGQHDK